MSGNLDDFSNRPYISIGNRKIVIRRLTRTVVTCRCRRRVLARSLHKITRITITWLNKKRKQLQFLLHVAVHFIIIINGVYLIKLGTYAYVEPLIIIYIAL